MTWREYLEKELKMTPEQITATVTAMGGESVMATAFEGPIKAKEAAEAALAQNEEWYQGTVVPKISQVYQDAINANTRAAAMEARMKAAKEYGFLAEDVEIPGSPKLGPDGKPIASGDPNVDPARNPVDGRYVTTQSFTQAVESIPDMLANLTEITGQHALLFNQPLIGMKEMVDEARKRKVNVRQVWEEKYNVPAKRQEMEAQKQAAHDKKVGEEAVQKYVSEHSNPHTRPILPSRSPAFSGSPEEVRKPWSGDGMAKRKQERREKFAQATVQ
jgi:hypothetical protein